MKRIIILFAMLSLASTTFAQTGNDRRSGFHFSFFPPLSTHGVYAADYSNTASLSLLVGLSKNEEAFSLAGLANIVRNDAKGFQMAGLMNYSGNNGSGVMFSGLGNIVGNDYHGFQMAGLINKAGNTGGFQLAGLGNIAHDVRGFQLGGLFNVAKNVSGAQFAGLVNIAESNDFPIALLNIIKNGEYGVSVGYNEMGSIIASLRSGGRVTYGIIGIGYNHKSKGKSFVTEGGLGAHINVAGWLRINYELKGGSIGNFSNNSAFYCNYALLPSFQINRHIEIFGGPSINYMNSDNISNSNLFPGNSIWKKHTQSKLEQVYIGYQAGIQFIL